MFGMVLCSKVCLCTRTCMVWYGKEVRTCAFRKPFSAVSPRLIVPCTAPQNISQAVMCSRCTDDAHLVMKTYLKISPTIVFHALPFDKLRFICPVMMQALGQTLKMRLVYILDANNVFRALHWKVQVGTTEIKNAIISIAIYHILGQAHKMQDASTHFLFSY